MASSPVSLSRRHHLTPRPAASASASTSTSLRRSRLPVGCAAAGLRCQAQAGDMDDDGVYIRRCVELARKAAGHTSPNPMVGCVVVRGGRVVGEGFHPEAGQPHAEVFALRDAGDLAENATAYVSLEPCNHYGRTPPCTEALINAKVKDVVVMWGLTYERRPRSIVDGMTDPNPIVASKGIERLQSAGIDVRVCMEEEALCRKLNEAYIHRMLAGKAFATLREAGGDFASLLKNFQEEKLVQKVVVELLPIWAVSKGPGHLAFGGSQSFPLKDVGHKEVNGCMLLEDYV
ncbi:hypothetical protein OsI_15040 [Oryza sativa Indica Group]|uniref:diaminohydroxyphosphoribosylaminopyrimidine deaminase n=1 Tax=Oryza sativa subsp. indica TaxID=39946 RepID=B8AR56_ORYSI|nr:hypothetical protein OsI_15040 [Oryza sativa Indica Group]